MSNTKSQVQEPPRTPNRINAPNKLHLSISFSSCRKVEIKKKVIKEARGGKAHCLSKSKGKNYFQLLKKGVKYLKC